MIKKEKNAMTNNKYTRAYTEVLEIISHFTQEEYSKIPKEEIEFYKKNMDSEYEFKINPEIELEAQNISKEANAIIVRIFMDYFATEEQKTTIKEILELNQRISEQEKKEKYNPDDLFKLEKKQETDKREEYKQNQLIEYKETFFSKFKKFVLKLLNFNK